MVNRGVPASATAMAQSLLDGYGARRLKVFNQMRHERVPGHKEIRR